MAYESWVDRQIREAEARGEFDNLPGAGKPLKNLDKPQDDDWWIKGLMQREQLSFVLPTSLALRKEIEDLPETVRPLWREGDVREVVDDLNERIVEARRRPSSGPPVFVKTVDVDQVVADWRADREKHSAGRSPGPGTAAAASVPDATTIRKRRWWRRR
jgi:hypothetical protein